MTYDEKMNIIKATPFDEDLEKLLSMMNSLYKKAACEKENPGRKTG